MPKTPRSPPDTKFTPPPRVRAASGTATRRHAARIIEVLAFPDVQLLDVTGPLQVFATANEQAAQTAGAPPYLLRVIAKDTLHVTASAGLQITTEKLPRAGVAPDT